MQRTEPTVSYEYVLPGAAGLRQTGRKIARRASVLAQRPDVQRLATELVRAADVPAKDHEGEARVLWEIMAGERPYITPDGRELTMRYQREYGEVIRDPDVLLLEAAGDCDDFTLFLLATLGALGFEGDAVVMRRTNAAGVAEWHVYPIVHPPDGSQSLVLDATPVLPEGPAFDWAAPNDGPGNVWAYQVGALPDPIGAVVDTVIGLVQDVVGGGAPTTGGATASRVFAGAAGGGAGGLSGLALGASLGAIPQHGPEAALVMPGDTRIATVYEFLGPTGNFARVSPQTFAELEAGFRELGDVNSLTSKLRWGDEQQTLAETRWSTSTLPEGRNNWFRPNAAQWAEYTSSGISGDPRVARANCWAPGGRMRHCRIVKNWRAEGAVAWDYPQADVVSIVTASVKTRQGRMALYLGLAAAGFFGWRVMRQRRSA